MSKLIALILAVVTIVNMTANMNFDAFAPTYYDEPAVQTPVVEEVPAEDDSALIAEIEGYVNSYGINGFIMGAGGWPNYKPRLREFVYQVTDEGVDYATVKTAYIAATGEEVHLDLTYVTADTLDYYVWLMTGYDLMDENGQVLEIWDMSGMTYLSTIDTYVIQHGDTNYQPLRVEILSKDEDFYTIRAYSAMDGLFGCRVNGEFQFIDYIDMELWHWDEGLFEFVSITPKISEAQ